MKKGLTAVEHYRDQRDILFYELERLGYSRRRIAKLLNVHPEAISRQFPPLSELKSKTEGM